MNGASLSAAAKRRSMRPGYPARWRRNTSHMFVVAVVLHGGFSHATLPLTRMRLRLIPTAFYVLHVIVEDENVRRRIGWKYPILREQIRLHDGDAH